jgi:protein SCO1/2
MQRRFALRSLAAGALAGAAGALLAGCGQNKPQFSSIDLTGADYAKDFQLPDQDGKVRSLKDFQGKVVVLFFGYTQCPDVCPTTMTELAQVRKMLGADGDKLQVLFVTVDPERDTAQVLKGYMANFDPSFLALRPTPEQLALMAKDFKVFYKKSEGKTPGSYSMDHSAASYVYDATGRLRLYTRYGSGVEALASDIRLLLKS